MTKKYILLFFIAAIAIAAIIAYAIWNKPHKNIKDAVAIEISSDQLYDSFANDSAGTKSKYINKVLSVSGKVTGISKNQQNQQIILLKTNNAGASVNCTMEESANNIKEGDVISVKGICSGYIPGDKDMELPGDVFLIRCYCLL
jgi:hypothetical protein